MAAGADVISDMSDGWEMGTTDGKSGPAATGGLAGTTDFAIDIGYKGPSYPMNFYSI